MLFRSKEREEKLKEKLKGYTMDELLDLVILGLKQETLEDEMNEQGEAC